MSKIEAVLSWTKFRSSERTKENSMIFTGRYNHKLLLNLLSRKIQLEEHVTYNCPVRVHRI